MKCRQKHYTSMTPTNLNIQSALARLGNRRQALKRLGASALGLSAYSALAGGNSSHPKDDDRDSRHENNTPTDTQILTFALNLEYLEAEFYTRAVTGSGIQDQGVDVTGYGTVGNVIIKTNPKVPFATATIQSYIEEIAEDEIAHVKLLRGALGSKVIARPTLDLQNSFTAAAQAAGLIGSGDTFDPFADELSFLLAAFIFEDVGVTAYRGAAPLVDNATLLAAAAGLLGTEAYHAATIRSLLYYAGASAQSAAQKISDLRDSLDGSSDDDQGVAIGGEANVVPTDANGLVFARTMAQVLAIVYFSPSSNHGGFFPKSINAGPSSSGHH